MAEKSKKRNEKAASQGAGKGQETQLVSPAAALPLVSLRNEIDRLFERVAGGWPALGGSLSSWDPFAQEPFKSWASSFGAGAAGLGGPRADLSESDDHFELSVELPGMEQKDVEVTMTDTAIMLRGEKRQDRESKDKSYHVTERSYGAFRRAFPLPAGIDAGNVEASFSNGVLTVRMPKTKEAKAKTRRIEVKGAA